VIFPDFDFSRLQHGFLRHDFFSNHSTIKTIIHRRNKKGDSQVLSYGIKIQATLSTKCTGCPTRYRTQNFFNNFTTNEDIAKKFEADLPHCVRNVKETKAFPFQFRSNILISGKIIKEMPGWVVIGTPCRKNLRTLSIVEAFLD
jgi:hypothetical protein